MEAYVFRIIAAVCALFSATHAYARSERHDESIEYLICSGYYAGMANYFDAIGKVPERNVALSLMNEYKTAIFIYTATFWGKAYAEETEALGSSIRRRMVLAMDHKDTLSRYITLYEPHCERLKPWVDDVMTKAGVKNTPKPSVF